MSATNLELRTLKQNYKIAYAAYQSCVKALTEADVNGTKPSAELLESELKALKQLTEARANLLAAMSKA